MNWCARLVGVSDSVAGGCGVYVGSVRYVRYYIRFKLIQLKVGFQNFHTVCHFNMVDI